MSNRTVTQLGAIVLMVPLMVPLSAQNQMVKGNTYADTVEVGVRTLTLIGAGLRERGWLDIYTMGAYAENRTCDPQMLISMDGAKSLRIDLLRDVDAKSMAAEVEKALEKNLPPDAPPDLRSQIDTFRGYFKKDLEKGDSMEMTYVLKPAVRGSRSRFSNIVPGERFKALEKNLPPDAPPDLRSQIEPSGAISKKTWRRGTAWR